MKKLTKTVLVVLISLLSINLMSQDIENTPPSSIFYIGEDPIDTVLLSPYVIYTSYKYYIDNQNVMYRVKLSGYYPRFLVYKYTLFDTIANYQSYPIYEDFDLIDRIEEFMWKSDTNYTFLGTWNLMVQESIRDSIIQDAKELYNLQ